MPEDYPPPIDGPVHIAKRCGLCLQLRDEFILEVVPRHEPIGLLVEQLGVYAVVLHVFDAPLGSSTTCRALPIAAAVEMASTIARTVSCSYASLFHLAEAVWLVTGRLVHILARIF